MAKNLDDVFDDDGGQDPGDDKPKRTSNASFSWASHALLLGAGCAMVLLFVIVTISGAKARLNAPVVKKAATAVAAPSDLGFCTDGFKTVLRRVLDSCGLLTANQRRGCTPGNLKQVAAISDKDFVALFNPLADRAGIMLFDSGKDELNDETKALLEKKWTDARGASVFLVVARASPEGDVETNQALSHKRANSVLFHLQQKFNDPELEQKVGLLWLGEEYAQLSDEYCKWEHAGLGAKCSKEDINRSAFVSWIDCQL
jgi:outer membrane protein OmpA-like peptidoglycan-associated protein